jgi:hypothetical protein
MKKLYTYKDYVNAVKNWENGKRDLMLQPFWKIVNEEVLK